MRRICRYSLLALVPVVALALTLAAGCTGKPTEDDEPFTPGPTKPKEMKELVGTGKATLKGKVTLEGSAPNTEKLTADLLASMDKQGDRDHCKKGTPEEVTQQKWRVKDGAVKNVYVWLRAPDNSYFKLDDAQKKPARPEIVLDQPHCAFTPHCEWYYPAWFDGKTHQPTGQKMIVKNSAPISHNSNFQGGRVNGTKNVSLTPGSQQVADWLKPDPNTAVNISCNIHPWMNANLWVFDHPFVAITNEKGEYEIKDAPAGVDLQIVAWHESAGFINAGGTNKGEKAKLNAGDNSKDFTVKAPN